MASKFNKALAFIGALATPALCFAEGETTAFDSALTQIQTGMTDTIGKIVPVVAVVVVAAIGLWAIPFAWRKLRGSAGR